MTNADVKTDLRLSGEDGRAWTARVITLFPVAFPGSLGLSLIGKALAEGLWKLEVFSLRDFGVGHHRHVDDLPTGGGPGMVLRADVVAAALDHCQHRPAETHRDWPVIYLSPRGKPFTQATALDWSGRKGITLLCGRYEGVDERVLEHFAIEEVSVGDFVLSGGEIAAQALIEATVRLIPRVLGNQASTVTESFSDGLLEYPQFTRPRVWKGLTAPNLLLSGHHSRIEEWRRQKSEEITRSRRPDMWRDYCNRQGIDPKVSSSRN